LRTLYGFFAWILTHRLTQVALAYVAVAYLLRRAAWIIRLTWRLPRWTDQATLIVLVLGLIPVMMIAARGGAPSMGADEVADGVEIEPGDVAGAGDCVVTPARQDHRTEVA
jgi:hypothetical protein